MSTSLLISTHRLTISGVRKSEDALFVVSCDWAQAGPLLTIPIFGPKSVSCLLSFEDSAKLASTSGAFAAVARAVALRDVLVSVLARYGDARSLYGSMPRTAESL
jgi:hypothetical protein